ncbi:MAG: branched-chain amino acid transaminase [Gammaproteobacteria bacterium]
MQATDYIWQNGEFKLWHEATVHVLAHTLHYGGGAFEGIRVYQTARGPAIFRLTEHVDRLIYSAQAIGMQLAYDHAAICQIIIETVRKNNMQEGYVRPLFYYGYNTLGVSARNNPVEFIVACWPWGQYLAHDAVDVKISKYIRIHPDSTIADAKLCGHYLNSQLASLEIRNTHYHEVLLLDADGFVAEGAGENIFMVKDRVLYTPTLGNILGGITRQTVMEMAHHYGYPVVEDHLTVEAFYKADEAFFTGTAAEVTAIRSINDKIIGHETARPVTEFMKGKYHQLVRGELDEYRQYLTLVAG